MFTLAPHLERLLEKLEKLEKGCHIEDETREPENFHQQKKGNVRDANLIVATHLNRY